MMRQINFKNFLITVICIFFVVLVLACASQEKDKAREPQEMTLKGMIVIYGNEPHTWVGIETVPDRKVYAVTPPEKAKELRGLQGHLLEFTVTIRETILHGVSGTAEVRSWQVIQ